MTVSVKDEEQILVVPTDLLHSIGYFQGFCAEPSRYARLFEPVNLRFARRGDMESNPDFKQLIPYMLFTHRVRDGWADRIPAVVHVDGTARVQTVDPVAEPLVHRMLTEFRRRTGLPTVVNTSLNTAGRPMVDHPRDALECFGSAPIDALAIGPFLVRRAAMFAPEGTR